MFIKKIFVILIIILLFSCADPDMFEGDGEDIALYTVRNGGLQEYGSPVSVTLDYGIESPEFDTLEITLFSDSGIKLSFGTFSASQMESKTGKDYNLPEDLKKGLYHLQFRLLKSGRAVKDEIRSFFYDTDEYNLTGIRSYPPDPVPDEKITFKADFTAPDDSNPYFRWTVDNIAVHEGFASQNGNIMTLDAPSSDGVVPVSLEMLPFKPLENNFENFISFFNSDTVVFVSEKNRERSNEFSDEQFYRMLFHFRGEISDRGYLSIDDPADYPVTVTGTPDLDFKNSLYGLYFKKDDFISVSYNSVPFFDGKIAPFTFRMRMLPYTKNVLPEDLGIKDFPLFTAGDGEDFNIQIGMNGSSRYYINTESLHGNFRGTAEYFSHRGSEIIDLALNFYPADSHTDIVWFVNGQTVKTEKIPFVISSSSSGGGFTRIGGADFLVDEAGIYTGDKSTGNSVDYSLFKRYMEKNYNGDFIAAEGFDISGEKEVVSGTGRIRYESGMLCLDPETETKVFSALELNSPAEFKTKGESLLIIKNSTGDILLEAEVSEDNPVYFDPSESGNSELFDIYLVNRSRKDVLKIDNILILRNYSEDSFM